MTPEHAAEQLLAHGSLGFDEFVAITGWPHAQAQAVLDTLVQRKVVVVTANGSQFRARYWLRRDFPFHLFEPGVGSLPRLRRRALKGEAPKYNY